MCIYILDIIQNNQHNIIKKRSESVYNVVYKNYVFINVLLFFLYINSFKLPIYNSFLKARASKSSGQLFYLTIKGTP